MSTKYKEFDYGVIFAVILTGSVFGVFTGLAYGGKCYSWVGMIVGGICGYPLAKFYLNRLKQLSKKGHAKKRVWWSGVFAGGVCGFVCTLLIHLAVFLTAIKFDVHTLKDVIPGIPGIILGLGGFIGLGMGFVVGGICSLIYVLLERKKGSETV